MADTTITSANSRFTIRVPGLFPTGVTLQGYSSDKAFATESIQLAEVQMGVDGRMTAGYTPMPTKQTISLQADSPSRSIFATLTGAIRSTREVFYIFGEITLPSTGESYSLRRGILTNTKQIADAEKVLRPLEFEITWESIDRTVI